ncbi:MAG: ankyrin repeat domain-containing protein [Verrucomicrobiota bacterium]|nr:ankyrin repeat domain-containing protein [Verrucomicrobiota bacterium]
MKHLLITTIAAVLLVGCGPNIHEASWTGNIEAVKQHIAAGTDVNAPGDRGKTPLHIAAVFSRNEIAKLLIAKGADVNAKDEIGWTPLHHAAYSFTQGHDPTITVELLITKGADVNAKSEGGKTPLDTANNWGHGPAVATLRKHGGKTGEELKAEGK